MTENTKKDKKVEELNENVQHNFIWDISRQKYVELLKETQEIKIVEKEHIKRELYLAYKNNWDFVSKRLFLDKNLFIPSRYLTFNPHKEEEWEQNGFVYQNTYIESHISYRGHLKRAEGLIGLNNDLAFVSKYPCIEALLKNLLPNEKHYKYFLNWISYIFATKKKTRTAILFRGVQGTGKGVLWEQIIEYFVGRNYTKILENDSLKSNFTPRGIENTLFVLANEIKGDFRDGNNMYEKLKMYISDPTVRIEEKGVQAFESNNFFNMIFFSNNDIPLQIQGGDRRYTVFQTKTRKLDLVAKEDFKMTIDMFIENIKKERDDFLIDLVCYAYDSVDATTCLETEEKERIYRASMTKIEILADKVKSFDVDFFENDLAEILESLDDVEDFCKEHAVIYFEEDKKISATRILNNMLSDIKAFAMDKYSIKNSYLNFLYKLFVDNTANPTKIGTSLNSHFGQSKLISHEGSKFRVREISEFAEENYFDNHIPF